MVDKLWGWSEDAQMISDETFAERDVVDLFRSVCQHRGVRVELTGVEVVAEEGLVTNRKFKLVLRGNGWTHVALFYYQIENGTVYGLSDEDGDEGRVADNLGYVGVLLGFDTVDEKTAWKMAQYFDRRMPKIKEAA
jgi:hypothetical protein